MTKPELPSAPDETAKTAGRGGLAIAAAKVSFILFGFVQQLILPRLIGVDGYGEISRVLAIVGIVNNVVVSASIQGVSRTVSSVPEAQASEAFRRVLSVHAVVAIIVSTGFAASAGVIADLVGAPHVASSLRLVGLVILFYGIYAPLVGALNGRRRFFNQAGLDIVYGVLRTIGLAGGALFFLRSGRNGVTGAVLGFVCAALIIVPFALSRTGIGKAGQAGPSVRSYLAFLFPLAAGQYFLNQLLQMDFVLLSRFVGSKGQELGLQVSEADRLMGVYRGAQLFAFLPYQMLMSVTFILFPMLARANAEGDREAVKSYTGQGVRLALILSGLMCSAIAGLAPFVLRFAFPEEIWSQGGDALRILSLGMGSLAILGIISAALASLGRSVIAMLLTGVAVLFVAAGCWLTVPRAAFGPPMLVQSATATAIALTASTVVGAVILRKIAGGFVSVATIVRVLAATGLCIALASRMPWLGKLAVIVEVAVVAVAYLALMIVTREVGREDLARINRVLGRRA